MIPKIPAKFIHVGFFDLICDSIFHYRQSRDSSESYSMNRNARASIISSALSIECYANALIQDIQSSSDCFNDLDRLSPLSKIEMFFRMNGVEDNINYGDHRIQVIKELIQVRNSYVHSKSKTISTTMSLPEDGSTHWILPMELEGERYKSLKIPKSSMFWNDDNAFAVLKAILQFYKYTFSLLEKIKDDKDYLLINRISFKNFIIPNTFSEFDTEIKKAIELGLDIEFLKPK